ncbi:kinase-like domain-containing protein [Phascolomyces articulosus]|uniref:Kinase-like domain-containing protein n=1 Tax=Phascolomyces articulosus TaxID=60185 RepID=A0AAD5JWY3_9FUNG|nr:kinase-like domain-containing protein [Phascolomyces articulosus]
MGIFRAVLHPKEHYQQQQKKHQQSRTGEKGNNGIVKGPPTPPSEPASPILDEKPFRNVNSLPTNARTTTTTTTTANDNNNNNNNNVSRTSSSCSSTNTSQSIHTISTAGRIQSHTQPNQHNNQPRFVLNPDGMTHQHCIKCMPPNKISASLQNLAAGLGGAAMKGLKIPLVKGGVVTTDKKTTTSEAVQKERAAVNAELKRAPGNNDVCLSDKWGTCHEVIGKGAFGVVRIVHKPDPSGNEYAVKEFRKKGLESTKQYVKRLTSEFCISSILHHPNVIETLDLLPLTETSPVYCQVMEYCDGGDLFNLIYDFASSGLQVQEANCFFKQLMRGVHYMHGMGIAHRDLKPENLLLTSQGCLKISDFGGADCFRPTPQSKLMYSRGICGSEPYIAPEMFNTHQEYDPQLSDVWSCAVIYMAMRTGNHIWQVAKKGEDDNYDRYLKFRRFVEEERENAKRERLLAAAAKKQNNGNTTRGLSAEQERELSIHKARESVRRRAKESGIDIFEGLELGAKRLIYRMLDPNPNKRINVPQIMQHEWFKNVYCCQPTSLPSSTSTTTTITSPTSISSPKSSCSSTS